jgi:hypothetical protein
MDVAEFMYENALLTSVKKQESVYRDLIYLKPLVEFEETYILRHLEPSK